MGKLNGLKADNTDNKKSTLLIEIEKRLNKNILTEFKGSGENWPGRLEHETLFYFWKKVKEDEKTLKITNNPVSSKKYSDPL